MESKACLLLQMPFEVYLQGNDVSVHFLECLGTLDVSVESSSGQTVYQRTIDTCAENTILIDTNNWNAGWYKIMITDIYGGYVEGWFEI